MSPLPWPDVPDGATSQEKLLDAQLARVAADDDARLAIEKAYVDGIIGVAKGSIDRARASAQAVQTAAAAIVTIYTAVLGVSFSVTSNPLPSRGLVPAVLLGSAIVFSTVYLAYLSRPDDGAVDEPKQLPGSHETVGEVVRQYVLWSRAGAFERRYWIRASVIALGVGLLFLPAPFVSFDARSTTVSTEAKAWPGTPTEVDDAALRKLLYAAQVEEVATARASTKAPTNGHDGLWWLAGLVAMVAVLTGPKLIERVVGGDTASATDGKVPGYMLAQ